MKTIYQQQSGGILLLVLLMLLVFVIISAASVRFIARQANQTVLQEQEEQAFEIADAGVNYVLWLLSGTGGNFTPLQLVASPPPSTTNHPVTDTANQTIGKFDLFFGPACAEYLEFRAVGYDQIKTNLCQVVDARVQRFTSGEYKLVKWDHLVGYPCNQSYLPPSPAACATPLPSPTATPSPSFSPSPSPTPSCNPANCPAGWQCGTSGQCEANSCDDMRPCNEDLDCPPDHERVSFCVAGQETFRDWSCCESCNEELKQLCGLAQGGYCEPTYYSESCQPSPTPTPTPTPTTQTCVADALACTIGGTPCCSPNQCINGTCQVSNPPPGPSPACKAAGSTCAATGECCSGLQCTGTVCAL